MIRHKLSLLVICAALATQGQVLCRWTADSSRTTPVEFSCFRGETLLLTPTIANYGAAITNYTATLLWQTNGMGTAWWSTNVLAFTPSMDVGATRYTIFIRAATTNGVNYRANGTITMRNAPGFTPNTLPLPVPSIDFATVTPANAPWLLAEVDPGIPDAIASAVAQAGTNAQSKADQAQANAIAFASTNPVYKVYAPGSATEWIDGAGNKYVVSNLWSMTFSADFGENVFMPTAQTNYVFSSSSQVYTEGTPTKWWINVSYIYHFPGGFYNREWLPTTNALVLDPVLSTGATGHAYIRPYTTTNYVTLASEGSIATKVSTNDATYLLTVSKAESALQVQTQQVYVATAGTAESATTVTGAQSNTIDNALQRTGDTATGPILTTVDHTTMAPADNELITGGFARSLLSFGRAAYMTTNMYTALWQPTNTTGIASYENPSSATNTFAVGSAGTYIATMVDTNAVSAGVPFQGPSTIHIHLGIAAGSPTANYSLSVKPEIYYTYSLAVTNLTLGDFDADAQTWTSGQNTGKDFAIAWPTVYPTNAYYRVYRLKVVAKGSSITSCTMSIGGTDSSYVTYQTSGEEASAVQANLNVHTTQPIQTAHYAGVWSNQTWAAIGTNATYRMSWDVTNGTFRVEEILP